MPHRRIAYSAKAHPVRTTLMGVAVVGSLTFAFFLVGHKANKNAAEIKQRPTKDQIYQQLIDVRRAQRRACQVVNTRFNALADLVHAQRPSAATTAYYQEHPEELARQQAYVDRIVRILRPRNCFRDYPPPNPVKFGLPSRSEKRARRQRRPAGPRGPTARAPDRTRRSPQAGINPPPKHRPPRQFPPSRPVRQPTKPVPPPPSPNLPGVPTPTPPLPAPTPTVRDRLCADPHLAPLLPFCP